MRERHRGRFVGEWAALGHAAVRQRTLLEVGSEARPVSALRLLDRAAFLAGEDFDAGPIPPGEAGGRPIGLTLDAQVGRFLVRFLCVLDESGLPRSAAVWKPKRPATLKRHLVKKYRRVRREFLTAVVREFGVGVRVIDRMDDGQPRVTELIYEDGAVEAVDPPVPYLQPEVH